MNCSSSFNYNLVKNLLKITINDCEEDSNSFESLAADLDYQSLHPNYECKCFQMFKKKNKTCQNKLSLQIENFIKINFPGRVQTRPNSSNSSTQEQNELEELVGRQKEIKKTSSRCSSACIIG